MPPCSGHAVGAPQLQAHAQVRAAGSPRPQPACSGRPRPVGCHADEHWPPAGLGVVQEALGKWGFYARVAPAAVCSLILRVSAVTRGATETTPGVFTRILPERHIQCHLQFSPFYPAKQTKGQVAYCGHVCVTFWFNC